MARACSKFIEVRVLSDLKSSILLYLFFLIKSYLANAIITIIIWSVNY